jgi:pyruvate/2-oxoglutarate dehydrogenase complex dihydrolipoamide acyltransferase (E2) component
MLIDFLMPDLGLTRGPAAVSIWLVDVGGEVLQGESLLEVTADGAAIDLPSPADGVLEAVFVGEDDPLTPGQRLAVVAIPAVD